MSVPAAQSDMQRNFNDMKTGCRSSGDLGRFVAGVQLLGSTKNAEPMLPD